MHPTTKSVLDYLRHRRANGPFPYPPTLDEIADSVHISRSTASYHVGRLAELGYIRHVPRIARGIVLLDNGEIEHGDR